jgi:hypothetical protein
MTARSGKTALHGRDAVLQNVAQRSVRIECRYANAIKSNVPAAFPLG